MLKRMCTGKIAKAIVTKSEVEYDGSMGIDSSILVAAGIHPYEMVLIANLANGQRLETYTIPEPAGSGTMGLYGGAAKLGAVGDELIIMAYGYMDAAETSRFKGPKVIKLARGNKLA